MSRHCMQTNECLWSWKQPHFLFTEISGTKCKKKEKKVYTKSPPKKGNFCSKRYKQNHIKYGRHHCHAVKCNFIQKDKRKNLTLLFSLLYWLCTSSGDVGHSSTWCDKHDFTIQHRDASSVLSKFPHHLWICYPSRVYLHLEYDRLHIMRF